MNDDSKFFLVIIAFVVVVWFITSFFGVMIGPDTHNSWNQVGDGPRTVRIYCDPWNNRVYIISGWSTDSIAVVKGDCPQKEEGK